VSPIGGVTPLPDTEREKAESALRQRMETLAEEHGISPALGAAMVTLRIAVVRARNRDTGEVRFVEEDKLFELGPEWEKAGVVDSPDTLLTVGSKQALEYGIARHVVDRLEDLYDLYPIQGTIDLLPVTWSETAVQALNNMYVRALLVLVGLLGFYVEMHTPGFGVPGTIGLVAFGILFACSLLADYPNWLAPLLFVVGLVLLLIEVFITPGFGVLGVSGILLMVVGILLALPNLSRWPRTEFEWSRLYTSLALTAGILAVFGVMVWLLARFFPHLPILRHLVLAPSTVSDGSSRAAAAPLGAAARAVDTGKAFTDLHPAGKARFGNRLVDVVTEGDFLARGADVRVIMIQGNRVIVRSADRGEADAPTA
jgi:membrane-bound serine protease (ClpP class)